MAFGIKGSHIVAVLIAGGVIGWMWQGDVIIGGQAASENATPPPALRAQSSEILQQVRYVTIEPQTRNQILSLRGRTEASSTVKVRAETNGIVQERVVDKGQMVSDNDVLCKLEAGTRQSALIQAQTNLKQTQADLEAYSSLQSQGYATNSRTLALSTARDAAKSQLEQAERELENTIISARTSGIVQDPIAEVGDLLNAGDVCVTIVQTNPMKFIGQVSERKVSDIATGDQALVNLVSGQQVGGMITYIAPTADPKTRTFKVEIIMPNDDNLLRDGVTAQANIALEADQAFQVKPSWLTLSDAGDVGVRTIGNDDIVEFIPVQILAQSYDAMWVSGLKPGHKIITLGQEYVAAGQKVIAVQETALSADLTAETNS